MFAASSLAGIPVSTTHTKTTAIMGVGASMRLSAVTGVVKDMVFAWILNSLAAAAGIPDGRFINIF